MSKVWPQRYALHERRALIGDKKVGHNKNFLLKVVL